MKNYLIQYWIILKIWTKDIKASLITFTILSICLFTCYYIFILCNQIPYREITISIERTPFLSQIENLQISLKLDFSGNSKVRRSQDETPAYAITITPDTLNSNTLIRFHKNSNAITHTSINSNESFDPYILKLDTLEVDSIASIFDVILVSNYYNNFIKKSDDSEKTIINKQNYSILNMKSKHPTGDSSIYVKLLSKIIFKTGYNNEAYCGLSYRDYTLQPPSFYSLFDISQCYLNLTLNNNIKFNVNKFDLLLDFMAPTNFGTIYPEPDKFNSSQIQYTNKEKLFAIPKDGLLIYANSPSRQNLQNSRNFVLTSIITLLFTLTCTVLYKIIQTKLRKRKKYICVKGFVNTQK